MRVNLVFCELSYNHMATEWGGGGGERKTEKERGAGGRDRQTLRKRAGVGAWETKTEKERRGGVGGGLTKRLRQSAKDTERRQGKMERPRQREVK